jgi:hypothetical protein
MKAVQLNESLIRNDELIFAGDYEVVGPDPALGHDTVASLGVSMILIHYHHRHEFAGGGNKGLWGTLCQMQNKPCNEDWSELDRVVESAKERFPLVGLYPIGWAHMVPRHLGETVQDVDPEVVSDWVADVVDRYWKQVDVFPIFYEINVFDLFFRATHEQGYGDKERRHILQCLTRSTEKVEARSGRVALSKLTAATFVELTQSSFYWMSEGKLLELPRGSSLLEAPLCPADLLDIAKNEDTREGGSRHTKAMKQLLHQLIFWNADDSGANNTVGDDLYRVVNSGLIFDPVAYPEGVVHYVIAGWDAQPQNTYEYLLKVMRPDLPIPSPAECLDKNYEDFARFRENPLIPKAIRDRVVGFVLDDVFKCVKQSGITSAVFPTETIDASGLRIGSEPVHLSEIGGVLAALINNVTCPQREKA